MDNKITKDNLGNKASATDYVFWQSQDIQIAEVVSRWSTSLDYSNEELSQEIKAVQKAIADMKRTLTQFMDNQSSYRRERCWE